jgi:mRNA-degrading endonuclease toxin of MazEF toxin-antitoxin module
MMRRGDVVIVAFPFATGGGGKNRPAVVVQCDRDNRRLSNTIVAMITGNISYASSEPTQLLLDPSTVDRRSSGLNYASSPKCSNLYTIDQEHVIATIGLLSPSLMSQVDSCLKAALGLP